MKVTRRQKLRKKDERQRQATDRKTAVLEHWLEIYGVNELLRPFGWTSQPDLLVPFRPRLKIAPTVSARDEPLVAEAMILIERFVDTRFEYVADDRAIDLSLNDLLRAAVTVLRFIEKLILRSSSPRNPASRRVQQQLLEVVRRCERFQGEDYIRLIASFFCDLNEIAEGCSRLDERIIWFKVEASAEVGDPLPAIIVVGVTRQVPSYLPVSDGRRKAFPCMRSRPWGGVEPVVWNPARLGLSADDRPLPVFISDHAIHRLHERLPIAPNLSELDRLVSAALDWPELQPAEEQEPDRCLVALRRGERKYGYLVAELYPDFVFVRTFLFLTMQGTPEAKQLRDRLGLSRADIEYFKLDHYLTLAHSDVGQDPELRAALTSCGCGHLVNRPDDRPVLSWLSRYGDPFRREIGLPTAEAAGERSAPAANEPERHELDQAIAAWHSIVKRSDGWNV